MKLKGFIQGSMQAKRRSVKLYLLVLIVLFILVLLGIVTVHQMGGTYNPRPERMESSLSDQARSLIDSAFSDLQGRVLVDYHTHILGVGNTGSGIELNPMMMTWRHPFHRIKTSIFMSGSGIADINQADQQYLERLTALIKLSKYPSVYYILAFDKYYNPDGSVNGDKTHFYIPNEYVFNLTAKYPENLKPAISVHPYRKDALQELEKWGKRGVKLVKWLPNSQGINAADPRNDQYYALLKQYDMRLLTHVGEEQAVESVEDQAYGNPLLFRRPLDLGVKVIMAHAASLGANKDIDNNGEPVDNFKLLIRLMDEPKYQDNLFMDISALTQFNRLSEPLMLILTRKDLHARIVNGSDYPLPALNMMISTKMLKWYGFITDSEKKALNEVYRYSPLLFDYVVKRTLKHPHTKDSLPGHIFTRGIDSL